MWVANGSVPSQFKFRSQYPSLAFIADRHYDAIVVGGGVFGCTTAYLLKQEGLKVALIEARTICSGVSSYSTAKLTAQHGAIYSPLIKRHGFETASNYYRMNMRGLTILEEIIAKHSLDCDHAKREHILWTSVPQNSSQIVDEFEICRSIDIPCRMLEPRDLIQELPSTIEPVMGLAFESQSMFNPYKYCQEIVKLIQGDGSDVFENSRISMINDQIPVRVTCQEHNCSITADKVVLATHIPIMDRSFHFAFLEPSKSHCVAVKIKKDDEGQDKPASKADTRGGNIHNMFINVDKPLRSLRSTLDGKYLVVAGEAIPQGDETETQVHYDNLISWASQHFNVEEVYSQWSAMDYYSPDIIPYIGYLYGGTDNIFTATGFSKWGLSTGIVAAEIITDTIQGRQNPYVSMVNARRWEMNQQISGYIHENVHVGKHFVKDKIVSLTTMKGLTSLKPDEGGLVRMGLRTVGAYRDPEGAYHVVNPICSHLGCTLLFNSGDKLWDCPCHGSQFDVDGKVIHGPAVKPITPLTDLEW